jgi:hypothetical protein
MSSVAIVTDAPMSMVTRNGLSCIQHSATRLSLLALESVFSAKRGIEGDDAAIPLFTLALPRFPSPGLPPTVSTDATSVHTRPAYRSPFLRRLAGGGPVPVGALIFPRSPVSGSAAAFASSSSRAWFTVSLSDLSLPMWCCMKSTVCPTRARCANCLTAVANCCSDSPTSWVLSVAPCRSLPASCLHTALQGLNDVLLCRSGSDTV